MSLDLSVVIPTFQRRDALHRLLSSMENTAFDRARFEVVVAIDGSTDSTAGMLETLRPSFNLIVCQQENRGRAAACNLGVRAASGTIVVLLDDDMQPVPGFLHAHLAAHQAAAGRPSIVVGPVPIVLPADAPPIVRYRSAVFENKDARLAECGRAPRIRDVYTGNASFPRSLFLQVGGFDEEFRVYGHEDFELLDRMVEAGAHIVYAPQAVAHQHYEKTVRDLARDIRSEGQTAVLFASKRPAAFNELELAAWPRHSVLHRSVLSALLHAGARWPRLPDRLVSATERIERLNPPFLTRWYNLVFDYLYWVGAVQDGGPIAAAVRSGSSITSALATLARDVRPSA